MPALRPVAALSVAQLGELLARTPLSVGRFVLANVRLVPTGFRCPPAFLCPAHLIEGLDPAVTVRSVAGPQGPPETGTFALRVVSASTLDMVGVVTAGPRSLWWTVAEALRAPARLIVINAYLGVNRRALPCPSVPGTPDPWTGGYGCGHAEWLADTPALPSEHELRPPGSLPVRNGAWDAFAPLPAASEALPAPLVAAWLVEMCGDGRAGECPAVTVLPAGAILGRIDPT